MIQKLRHRFILITMVCISLIFILILLVLNLSMTLSSRRQGYALLTEYADRQLFFNTAGFSENSEAERMLSSESAAGDELPQNMPRHPGKEKNWLNDMRIFSVICRENDGIFQIQLGENPNLTEALVQEMAEKIMKNPKSRGIISGYLYIYDTDEEGTFIYFLDYTPEKGMAMQLFRICLWVGLAGILVIFIPVVFLSRWVTKPVQLAFDKQKRFIADASHELKTPLTIITTNAEVLECSLPGNKWLSHILEQSDRMKNLINSLLTLAKLDADKEKQDFIQFDLSKAVRNTALAFESLAFEYGKTYEIDIEDGIFFCGSESSICQLTTILLDNAFKYSEEFGSVSLRLSIHGGKKELIVRNSGTGISLPDQKRIFERFYRSDASRSRKSGGYGLGLAIAQSIVTTHKGTIGVKSDGKSYTAFYAVLP